MANCSIPYPQAPNNYHTITVLNTGAPELCPSHVILTITEYQEITTSIANPLNISVEEGLSVSAAIALCWAIVFGFRMAISALNVTTSNGGHDDD